MNDIVIKTAYARWLDRADPSLRPELLAMQHGEGTLADAFYRDLAFGASGLRDCVHASIPIYISLYDCYYMLL